MKFPEHDTWAVGRELYALLLSSSSPLHTFPQSLITRRLTGGVEVINAGYMAPNKIAFLNKGKLVGIFDLKEGEGVAFQEKAEAEVPTLPGQRGSAFA